MPVIWTKDLNTGIDLIDKQHRCLLDYINQLEDAGRSGDRLVVGETLDACVDYILSHFAFEESLQEEAGYQFQKAHKKVHELFARRIHEYQRRFNSGEDVAGELHDLLGRWLIDHIKRDDADYVGAVKDNMQAIVAQKREHGGWLNRFFG